MAIRKRQQATLLWLLKKLLHSLLVIIGAVGLAMVFFLVLPLMQTVSRPPTDDLVLQAVETAKLDAPPPPPQEEEKKEPEKEEKPPELTEEAPPLSLEQLEMALNPAPVLNESWIGGDFAVKLSNVSSNNNDDGKEADALFSITDLDQQPRVVYQPSPSIDKDARKKLPGKVYIVFIVNQQGKVENPLVQASSDPVFEKPALSAVKQWKFEPGKRNSAAVRFRMRVPIIFPKG